MYQKVILPVEMEGLTFYTVWHLVYIQKKYCFRLRLLWSMRKHCPQQVHRWSTILCVMIFVIKEDILEQITEETDFVVICNPNNPTGILTEKELILRVLERAKETNTFVMADECFLEICQNESEYTVKPFIEKYENLIILKSFTKLYAIPGVRLGYILAGSEDVIAKVNRTGQAWSVSHIAQCAGVAALSDNVYKERVIETVAEELSYMKKEFFKLPVILYDGAANYLFFQTPGITDLDRRLESYGIMIRNCSNYVNLGKDCWRVAVKSHEENEKLIKALRMILKGEE